MQFQKEKPSTLLEGIEHHLQQLKINLFEIIVKPFFFVQHIPPQTSHHYENLNCQSQSNHTSQHKKRSQWL